MEVQSGTKLSDYAMIYVIIFLVMVFITDSRLMLLEKAEQLNIQYDNALDNAVMDALEEIVELDDGETLEINKEEMIQRFFLAISMQLGLSEGDSAKERLQCFFPVMLLMLQDGIYSWEAEEGESGKAFSEKIPYCLEKDGYRICYGFDDNIVFVDKTTGRECRGNYQVIRKRYPADELSDENFDEIRRRTIIETVTNVMNRQMEKHNRFAEERGIKYHFSLPVIDMEEWYRTVDDVTLLCVFQGYPYTVPSLGTYDKVILSGARIYKEQEEWEEKEEDQEGKDRLSGEEEFYLLPGKGETEEDYFKEIEIKDIIEEPIDEG